MIDYLVCCPSEAAAKADPAIGAFYAPATTGDMPSPGGWSSSCVIAGVQVWLDSGDTTQTIVDPVMGTQTITTHTYLPGFWLVVSLASRSPALEASSLLVLGADRDAANAGASMAQYVVALGPSQALNNFVGAHVSPTFAGSSYPFA